MIPTEANYAEWFTCSVRYYLLKEGYAFLTFGVEQAAEPGFPATRMFAEGVRFVGLQFVRPIETASDGRVLAYRGDFITHNRMSQTDASWLFYAFPQSADSLDQQLTHQKVLFARASQVTLGVDGMLKPGPAIGFKQLLAGIGAGSAGRDAPVGRAPRDIVITAAAHPATLYLVVNSRDRIVFALYGKGVHE
jgi:hypothetical protein